MVPEQADKYQLIFKKVLFFCYQRLLDNSVTNCLDGVKVKMGNTPTKSRKPIGKRKDNQSRINDVRSHVVGESLQVTVEG